MQASTAIPLPLNLGWGSKRVRCCCQPVALPAVAGQAGETWRKWEMSQHGSQSSHDTGVMPPCLGDIHCVWIFIIP